ncbi:methyltransferase [Pararhodospirillum oryzae]|uniref:O-methyltransferase n=1 Tax=Pararhodospirillum oryzae TaxID=478448 RepID=A0A512H551_9PROT|nr:methyltransferase [Pararhodospirillum oryzae]GEO80567.1 O-methyltransferase [Pararhodospirillum oryzae]
MRVSDLWTSLADRLFALRDDVMARPGFQRWAADFLLTRPIAHHYERALFDVVAGFVHSQVLTACVRLSVFDHLAAGPLSAAELARRLDLPLDPAGRLFDAAMALRLLQARGGGRIGLGPLGAALRGNPGAVAMIAHHDLLYADLADPVALLRARPESGRTALGRYWAYARGERPAGLDDARVAPYSALMAATNALVSADVLDAFPLKGRRCLLDVGGGEGVFLAAALERAPQLEGMVFDLPPVIERARARLSAQDLMGRVRLVGGDFHADPLPPGADVITLVRVIHDHEDAAVLALLRACRAALAEGGTLLVAEPMAGAPGAESADSVAAYFLMYLLAMGSGRPRHPEDLMALLREAGFARVRKLPARRPLLVQTIAATP